MRRVWLIAVLVLVQMPIAWAEASRSFDGTNDFVDMGNTLGLGTGMVCAWVNFTEDATADLAVGKRAGSRGYELGEDASDFAYAKACDNNACATATGTTDLDGVWYWICGRASDTTDDAEVYVNGVSENSASNANSGMGNSGPFRIGTDGGSNIDALGLIAYARINNSLATSLTSTGMIEAMWFPDRMPSAGFWALWGDSPETDLSGNAHPGTVTAATTSNEGPPVMFGSGLPL